MFRHQRRQRFLTGNRRLQERSRRQCHARRADRDIRRIAETLGVANILEGSVRKAGTQVRITGQLIDALTGTHLWADRFDGSLEDIFELQDRVAVSVAGVIEPTLQAAEIRRSANRPTHDLTAYDYYLRALAHWDSPERDLSALAVAMLDQAIERDPAYAPALALAARCRCQRVPRRSGRPQHRR